MVYDYGDAVVRGLFGNHAASRRRWRAFARQDELPLPKPSRQNAGIDRPLMAAIKVGRLEDGDPRRDFTYCVTAAVESEKRKASDAAPTHAPALGQDPDAGQWVSGRMPDLRSVRARRAAPAPCSYSHSRQTPPLRRCAGAIDRRLRRLAPGLRNRNMLRASRPIARNHKRSVILSARQVLRRAGVTRRLSHHSAMSPLSVTITQRPARLSIAWTRPAPGRIAPRATTKDPSELCTKAAPL